MPFCSSKGKFFLFLILFSHLNTKGPSVQAPGRREARDVGRGGETQRASARRAQIRARIVCPGAPRVGGAVPRPAACGPSAPLPPALFFRPVLRGGECERRSLRRIGGGGGQARGPITGLGGPPRRGGARRRALAYSSPARAGSATRDRWRERRGAGACRRPRGPDARERGSASAE